jgi:TRAP-type mannitol/chloroaromatic compound transport system permease small subunit
MYPVKGMMVLGAILLTLAGLSKLLKDIKLFKKIAGGVA